MNTVVRTAAFAAVAFTVHTTETWWSTRTQPEISTGLALRQLNGTNADAQAMRWFEAEKNALHMGSFLLVTGAAVLLFAGPVRRAWESNRRRWPVVLPLALASTMLVGCVRPYDVPEFEAIDTAETGFLVPLEGDTKEQDKFQSETYLAQLKVASKRVQIPHRWLATGRHLSDGKWIPSMRLIKVKRSPVTREWTADNTTGTSHHNEAIWIESADSVAFSMGFNCTAYISEENAARFLYWYPSGTLAEVMDLEIRARIQQVAAEVAAQYPLDALRAKKQEITDTVRKDVTAFFAERGVTISGIGMFGGMTYENPEIQKSIDKTFIAQQEKVVNQARFEAQQRDNDRVELEATALAEKERRRAQGEADAKKLIALAEASGIREINKALGESQQNPLILQIKQLEVEKARVEKWTGAYPQYYLAPSEKAGLLLQLPAPR